MGGRYKVRPLFPSETIDAVVVYGQRIKDDPGTELPFCPASVGKNRQGTRQPSRNGLLPRKFDRLPGPGYIGLNKRGPSYNSVGQLAPFRFSSSLRCLIDQTELRRGEYGFENLSCSAWRCTDHGAVMVGGAGRTSEPLTSETAPILSLAP